MLFKNITIIDEEYNVLQDAFAAVEGDKITYVGSERPAGDRKSVV